MRVSIGKYLNDYWTLDDAYGIAGAGDMLARMALEVDPPFSIRVTGKWGAGKTSVLRRAFATLGGRPIQQAVPLGEEKQEMPDKDWEKWRFDNQQRKPKFNWTGPQAQNEDSLKRTAAGSISVWYSPWQHQGTDNPLIPLLLEIQAQFSTFFRMKKLAKRPAGLATLTLLERLVDSATSLFAGTDSLPGRGGTKLTGTTEAVRKAWREAAPNLTELSDGQRFHLLFEDAIQTALESLLKGKDKIDGERLIVFIDDLDRCEEAVIVRLLECIKLYLGSRHCVFILGLDDTAVQNAIRRCWGRSEDDNREYLEKMFQATIAVPLPRPQMVTTVINLQLAGHGFLSPGGCATLIKDLLEPNPRKLKNFCNSLCATWSLLDGPRYLATDKDFEEKFILIHYLRTFHRPVWRLIERQPEAAFILLHRVLTKSSLTDPAPKSETGDPYFDPDDQRMMAEMFKRAFLHVLADEGEKKDEENRFHLNVDLDKAVGLFEERLDRKRSDEHFLSSFIKIFEREKGLDDGFLYLPELPEKQGGAA